MKIHPPVHPEPDQVRAAYIRELIVTLSPKDVWEKRAHELALALLEAGHLTAAEAEIAAILERRRDLPPQ